MCVYNTIQFVLSNILFGELFFDLKMSSATLFFSDSSPECDGNKLYFGFQSGCRRSSTYWGKFKSLTFEIIYYYSRLVNVYGTAASTLSGVKANILLGCYWFYTVVQSPILWRIRVFLYFPLTISRRVHKDKFPRWRRQGFNQIYSVGFSKCIGPIYT